MKSICLPLACLAAMSLGLACSARHAPATASEEPSTAPGGHGPKAEAVDAWAPETAELALASDRSGNLEIYLLQGRSGGWKNLTNHPGPDNWPVWSPDGLKILFQTRRAGNFDIWVMDADGANQVQLTDDPGHDYIPAWSPDGKRISFTSWRKEGGETERANHVYLMNADGSDQRRFLAESPNTSAGLVWAPDGRTLALTRKLGEDGADIFLLDRAGAVTRRLTESPAYDSAGEFSPDGSRLAFYSAGGEGSEIAVVALDGSKRLTLVPSGEHYYPHWSPDGRWIVYTTAAEGGGENEWDLYAVRSDGSGEPLPLVTGPGRDVEGAWRPAR